MSVFESLKLLSSLGFTNTALRLLTKSEAAWAKTKTALEAN